jgi:hypothetical protein
MWTETRQLVGDPVCAETGRSTRDTCRPVADGAVRDLQAVPVTVMVAPGQCRAALVGHLAWMLADATFCAAAPRSPHANAKDDGQCRMPDHAPQGRH